MNRQTRKKRESWGLLRSPCLHRFISVPRGLPDEVKARKHIVAGFELVLFWCPLETRMWIGLITFTITSKRLLDMILTGKGVCLMLGANVVH